MDPILLILIALTDGPKTVDELFQILQKHSRSYRERDDLLHDLDELGRSSVSDQLATPIIRRLTTNRLELTTEGHVWLSDRPVIRFVVDRMNNLERNGLPRD